MSDLIQFTITFIFFLLLAGGQVGLEVSLRAVRHNSAQSQSLSQPSSSSTPDTEPNTYLPASATGTSTSSEQEDDPPPPTAPPLPDRTKSIMIIYFI